MNKVTKKQAQAFVDMLCDYAGDKEHYSIPSIPFEVARTTARAPMNKMIIEVMRQTVAHADAGRVS